MVRSRNEVTYATIRIVTVYQAYTGLGDPPFGLVFSVDTVLLQYGYNDAISALSRSVISMCPVL